MKPIVFIDAEIDPTNERVLDLGAVKHDHTKLHTRSRQEFARFLQNCPCIGGHNIIAHDLVYISEYIPDRENMAVVDTLCLSPLLFPGKPYHALLKDDKLQSDELNNPLNDAVKSMELFFDEINAFEQLDDDLKAIYYTLLHNQREFAGFFTYLGYQSDIKIETAIKRLFQHKICENASLSGIIRRHPIDLAYCLALIHANDRQSLTPPWVLKRYPVVENIVKLLRNTPCQDGCAYCDGVFNVRKRLKDFFGYDSFRTYNGEPLQEKAADAAVRNQSLLAIFPTGGGKSITFQLPALIAGETAKALTVVISPLQSLMKDQVDNLSALGITDAVTINGLLNSIERADAIERVKSGLATILYISPESLRSRTIENILMSRNIARFVIESTHR